MEAMFILLKNNINLESLVIAVVGYLIVFTALVLLYLLFSMTPRIINRLKRMNAPGSRKNKSVSLGDRISGEATAAIAMALYLHLNESHDEESGILTIKRISRAYSPWSSKIYAVRNQFNRQ